MHQFIKRGEYSLTAKPNLTRSTLKVILDSNSKLTDFMEQNNLDFMPCKDGITFCTCKAKTNCEECEPVVTIRWAKGTTSRLKKFRFESFQVDLEEFASNRHYMTATSVVAKSIMALYLAACTEIWASPFIKKWDFQTNQFKADAMLSTLREAIYCGDIPKESVDKSFFFKTNRLPSQIVDDVCWNVSADFERLADLSFVWLRNRWCTWANCIEFHEAAPCGEGIYDSAFAEPGPEPLNYVIHESNAKFAIAAMHDVVYSREVQTFKNEDIFDDKVK